MSNRKYFLASGESVEKVRKFFEARSAAISSAQALAAEVGGTGPAVSWAMVGVFFEGSAPDGWTSKGVSMDGAKYYMPLRRSKAGKELCKRMATIRVPSAADLHSQFTKDGGHLSQMGSQMAIHYISAEIIKGSVVISVPEGMDYTPPDSAPLKMSEYWALKELERTP